MEPQAPAIEPAWSIRPTQTTAPASARPATTISATTATGGIMRIASTTAQSQKYPPPCLAAVLVNHSVKFVFVS